MAIHWSSIDTFYENSTSFSLTEQRACPICGHNISSTVIELEEFQFFCDSSVIPNRTDIQQQQCSHCFCLYMNPVYSEKGYQILFTNAAASFGNSKGRTKDQADWLKNYTSFNKYRHIVDLGCHSELFLMAFSGFKSRTGIDIDAKVIKNLKAKNTQPDVLFFSCDFTKNLPFTVPENSIVSLLHVLEHIRNPIDFLVYLQTQLSPNTLLYLEVPILELGDTNDINGFFSVTHFTHFSRASLKACLSTSGWRILKWHEQKTYNGCRVLLEPLSQMSSPQCYYDQHDIRTAQQLITSWRIKIEQAFLHIIGALDFSNCIIWGAGLHTEFLYQVTKLFSLKKSMKFVLVDSDTQKQGNSWRGIMIYAPDILNLNILCDIPIIISSYRNQEEIRSCIVKIRGHNNNIFSLYDVVNSY